MSILIKRRLVLAAILLSGPVNAAPKAKTVVMVEVRAERSALEELEVKVTARLERALHELPGARSVNSMTGEDLVQVEIGFERDAIEADLESVRQLVLRLKWENLTPSIQFRLVGEKLN
jgi:Cu/Ag efflux pump CusA